MTFQEKKKAFLECLVIGGLIGFGFFSAFRNDMTNAAWAFGLAGGYVFKNGLKTSEKSLQ